jgi:hypothetical protein
MCHKETFAISQPAGFSFAAHVHLDGAAATQRHVEHGGAAGDVGHDRQSPETGNGLAQKLETLGSGIGLLERQSGDVAAGSRRARNEAAADRVSHPGEHDGCHARRLLCRRDRRVSVGDDDIDVEADELIGNFGKTLGASFRPPILNRDVEKRRRNAWLRKIGFVSRIFVYACLFGALFIFRPEALSEGWITTRPLAQLTIGDITGFVLWVVIGLVLMYALFNPKRRPDFQEAWGYFGLVLVLGAVVLGAVFLYLRG